MASWKLPRKRIGIRLVAGMMAILNIAGYVWIWGSEGPKDPVTKILIEALFGPVWTLFVFGVVGFVAGIGAMGWYLYSGFRHQGFRR